MAASGCVVEDKGTVVEAADLMAMVHHQQQKAIMFEHSFVYGELTCHKKGTKCLGRLDDPSVDGPLNHIGRSERNHHNNTKDVFHNRTLRFDRAGSTDSVAVSSSSDTCHSSCTGSEPCSPEGGPEGVSRPGTPQPMPLIPLALAESPEWRFSPEDSTPCRPPIPSSLCKWADCPQLVDAGDRLMEHIKQAHVDSQAVQGTKRQNYVCLWVGCKVYNRPSCSLSWLERHVLCHGGNKPFQCIVEGCRQRFTSQGALEKHVNAHFSQSGRNTGKEESPTKLVRKKKPPRTGHRRRCWAVKTQDFFDTGIMEHVRHGLLELESHSGLDTVGSPGLVTFHSSVIARRIEKSGTVNLLLRWTPEDVLPDCWVPESMLAANAERTVPAALLPRDQVLSLLDPSQRHCIPPKRRRK